MEWLIIIPICLLGGWILFSMLAGGTDEAKESVSAKPSRAVTGIVVLAIVVFIGFLIIGLLTGG